VDSIFQICLARFWRPAGPQARPEGDRTEFLRPEDGAWDTQDPNRFYFVTTDRFDTVKTGSGPKREEPRLWRLVFQDVRTPAAGGRIEMLLDGTGPIRCSTT
jgi:hypothetical protein